MPLSLLRLRATGRLIWVSVQAVFSLLMKLFYDFIAKVPVASYASPTAISFPEANLYIAKCQGPHQVDAIMDVQQELDETKIILVSVGSLAAGG